MDKREYEIQHFGFAAAQISLERRHDLHKVLSRSLDGLLEKLKTTSKDTADELLKQKEEVCRCVKESIDGPLNDVEALDRKYFTIPSNVLLSKDFELANNFTEQDELQLDKEYASVKQLFKENLVMLACLKNENLQYQLIESFLLEELEAQEQVELSLADLNLDKTKELMNRNKI